MVTRSLVRCMHDLHFFLSCTQACLPLHAGFMSLLFRAAADAGHSCCWHTSTRIAPVSTRTVSGPAHQPLTLHVFSLLQMLASFAAGTLAHALLLLAHALLHGLARQVLMLHVSSLLLQMLAIPAAGTLAHALLAVSARAVSWASTSGVDVAWFFFAAGTLAHALLLLAHALLSGPVHQA